jgi:HSP20 family protein
MNTIIKKNNNKPQDEQNNIASPVSLIDRFLDDTLMDPFRIMSPSLLRSNGIGHIHTAFPKVDVEETESEIRVTANVPGIQPEAISVEVGDDYLSLSGKIDRENKEEKDGKIYRIEREFGEFRREFSLPARVNKDGIVAKTKNGVLSIILPKSEEEKKKKIKIETE